MSTRAWRVLGCAALLACSPGEPVSVSVPVAAERVTGQFIWTLQDRERFAAARASVPELVPGVLVATVLPAADGTLLSKRGLSPALGAEPVALVVRLDDRVHAAFGRDPAELARELVALAEGALADARRTGASVRELQLDYDCPEQRLGAWARVAGEVRAHVDVPVWVTSIPAHLEHERYGELFRGRVAGHLLQLFDTGLPCSVANARHVAARARSAALPFRIGVGAFERVGRASEHACWRREAHELRAIAGWSGDWVFPGGEDPRAALLELRR